MMQAHVNDFKSSDRDIQSLSYVVIALIVLLNNCSKQ